MVGKISKVSLEQATGLSRKAGTGQTDELLRDSWVSAGVRGDPYYSVHFSYTNASPQRNRVIKCRLVRSWQAICIEWEVIHFHFQQEILVAPRSSSLRRAVMEYRAFHLRLTAAAQPGSVATQKLLGNGLFWWPTWNEFGGFSPVFSRQ